MDNLKEEVKDMKEAQERKVADMESEMTEYIQEIIRMKMVVAESEMKASEKVHLYNQLKKKVGIVWDTDFFEYISLKVINK